MGKILSDVSSEKTNTFINFLIETAKLSKCKEGRVAAMLVKSDFSQIFSIGINGGPAGQEDCLCGAKYGCVHAEANCLVKNVDLHSEKIMLCTKQCCQMCAALIVNSGANIKEFWYIEPFSDKKGLEILYKAGIKIGHLTSPDFTGVDEETQRCELCKKTKTLDNFFLPTLPICNQCISSFDV